MLNDIIAFHAISEMTWINDRFKLVLKVYENMSKISRELSGIVTEMSL